MKTTSEFTCIRIILLLLLSFSAGKVFPQHSPEWTHSINALPDSAIIQPERVLSDGFGNVYVLSTYHKTIGFQHLYQAWLSRIAMDGTVMWSRVFDNNGNNDVQVMDMDVDENTGHCYLSGGIYPSSPLVMKIDSSGNIVWQADTVTAFSYGYFNKVIVENNLIYLMATDGIAVLNLNGAEIWSDTIFPVQMAVDHLGRMVVSTYSPIAIVRYDQNGVLDFLDSTYSAERIAIDWYNNIYLLSVNPPFDYILQKYDSSGNFEWTADSLPPAPPFGDIGFEVLTDYSNSVYLVGLNDTMLKYTADGALVWRKPMNGFDSYRITAIMTYSDFVAVAGAINGPNGSDAKVALFNSLGVETWTGTYNSNNVQEFPVDLYIDGNGIYLLEDSMGNTDLLKFDSPVWSPYVNYNYVCIDSVWYDTDTNFINVRIYNGDMAHMNYPTVRIVSSSGDTISNKMNLVSFFAHLGNTYQVYLDSISVQGITDFSGYTFLMSDGIEDTIVAIGFCTTLDIDEIFGDRIILFPNPARDYIRLRLPDERKYSVDVFDCRGRLSFNEKFSGSDDVKIDINDLSAGIYFMRVMSEGRVAGMRFVKN